MSFAFLRKKPERVATPSTAHPAEDTLADVLRTFGKESFSLDGDGAESFALRCEAWARHVLLGTPPPLGATPATEARAYSDLRGFFLRRRKEERAYVSLAVGELKGALLEMVGKLREAISADHVEDRAIAGQLEELASMLEQQGSLREVRERVQQAARTISARLAAREAQRASEVSAMSQRLDALKQDLNQAKEEAELDGLTQLKNRAALDRALGNLVLVADLGAEPLALLLVDLDHFKQVNDRYGHPAGDAALKKTAEILVQSFPRKSDFIARYGGEEFAVLLPNAALEDAGRLAERCLKGLRGAVVRHEGGELSVTASIGVAAYRRGEGGASLLERADRALYRAKQAGRDQVALADAAG